MKSIFIYCFINNDKVFDCVDHNKLWKALKEMRTADYLTCLLRNLYADQAATVRILGVGDGQEGLACCNSWGRKELDMTERLI